MADIARFLEENDSDDHDTDRIETSNFDIDSNDYEFDNDAPNSQDDDIDIGLNSNRNQQSLDVPSNEFDTEMEPSQSKTKNNSGNEKKRKSKGKRNIGWDFFANEDTNDKDKNDEIDISFLQDKYERLMKQKMIGMQNNKNKNKSKEMDEDEIEKVRKKKENEVNWLSIPWEGNVPIIINFSMDTNNNDSNNNNNSNESNNDKIRKIWFARWMQDKKNATICIWDIPLSWNENDIRNIFSMFGEIRTASLQHTNDIISFVL